MTFAPALPPVLLAVIAVAIVALRLLTMRQLAATPAQRWSVVWRWSGLTLAVLLLLIAAARPAIGSGTTAESTVVRAGQNANVFLVVDRSGDSQITDNRGGQTRMLAIRDDIDALIERYPRARFALISFASRPSLDWPLSQDAWSLRPEVAALKPYRGEPSEQVNAAAAANVLRYQLIAAGQQYPDSQNLVYYFGSGAAESQAPQGDFDPVTGSVDGGAVFGYGATQNEPRLRRIADQLGVPYIRRDDGGPLPPAALDGEAPTADPAVISSSDAGRTELYWVFALAAAVLLLFEIYLSVREFRRTRVARRDVMS